MHSAYGFGMVNGGHYIREAILHYTNALLLSAGTGLETRSEQQIDLMRRYGVNVIVGFADYIMKLAEVARQMGLEPCRFKNSHDIWTYGWDDGPSLSETWVGRNALIGTELGTLGLLRPRADHNGLYIWEDAHIVEIIDPDSAEPVAEGVFWEYLRYRFI